MKRKLLGCLALITAMVCASQAATILDIDFSDQVAGTPLTGGETIADQSVNGYDATLIDVDGGNYDVIDVYGSGNLGLDTTASSSGNLAVQGFTLDGTADFTVEAVINWNGTTTANNGLFGQIGTLNGGEQLWIRENGGNIQYAIGNEGVLDANHFAGIDVSAAKADGLYHSFAFVYDATGGEIRTYLDGVLLHTNTDPDIGGLSTALLNSAEDINLGAFDTGSARDFNGIATQYRVSDTALATNALLVAPIPAVESDPPTPNPATFDTAPASSGITTIEMTATTGTDASGGIEYLFTESSGNPGGTSSGWISTPYYEDDGLDGDTEYTYTVSMRDVHGNTGTASGPASATTDVPPAGLYGINLSWEDDGVTGSPFTGWTLTSLGADDLESNDFRAAADPDNWFPDSTDGNLVMLLEGDNGDEYGRLSQQLSGGPLEGTYTFTVLDAGIASFGDPSGAQFKFGFSLDGTNMIAGSELTLTEGAELEISGIGVPLTTNVTYDANGTEDLYIIIETTGNHTGRCIPTIGSCTVDFVPTIDPDQPFLTIVYGAGMVTVGSTNLTNIAGVTNMLQSTDNLIVGGWGDESYVTGVTEAEWVLTTTNQNFYRIETTF